MDAKREGGGSERGGEGVGVTLKSTDPLVINGCTLLISVLDVSHGVAFCTVPK